MTVLPASKIGAFQHFSSVTLSVIPTSITGSPSRQPVCCLTSSMAVLWQKWDLMCTDKVFHLQQTFSRQPRTLLFRPSDPKDLPALGQPLKVWMGDPGRELGAVLLQGCVGGSRAMEPVQPHQVVQGSVAAAVREPPLVQRGPGRGAAGGSSLRCQRPSPVQ